MNTLNLDEWYDVHDAAKRLTANSGRDIDESYVRTLARYNRIRKFSLGRNAALYYKPDVDAYVVEGRGVKTARLNRQRALEKHR